MERTRKVDVVTDLDGNKIVFIHDIRFIFFAALLKYSCN